MRAGHAAPGGYRHCCASGHTVQWRPLSTALGRLRTEKIGMKFVIEKSPSPGRRKKSEDCEQHLYEAAVMLAMAQWLFECGAETVHLYPDGMHTRQFDIRGWLQNERFEKISQEGKTLHGGKYQRLSQTIIVRFTPGQGDVVACVGRRRVIVEAKGGTLNTRHSGQKSILRTRLYEAVGMLMGHEADRLIAAVPRHSETEKVASKIAKRCRDVGIEIALVDGNGKVHLNSDLPNQ